MVRNIVQGKACQEGHMDQGRVMFKLESSRPPKKCPWSPTHRNPAMMRRPWLCPLWDHTQGHDYDATFPHWQPYSETRRNVHLSASPSVFIDFERTKLTKSGDKAISREAKQAEPLRILPVAYLGDSRDIRMKINTMPQFSSRRCRQRCVVRSPDISGISSNPPLSWEFRALWFWQGQMTKTTTVTIFMWWLYDTNKNIQCNDTS